MVFDTVTSIMGLLLLLFMAIAGEVNANFQIYWNIWSSQFSSIAIIGQYLAYLVPVLLIIILFRFIRWVVFGDREDQSRLPPQIVFAQEVSNNNISRVLKSGD